MRAFFVLDTIATKHKDIFIGSLTEHLFSDTVYNIFAEEFGLTTEHISACLAVSDLTEIYEYQEGYNKIFNEESAGGGQLSKGYETIPVMSYSSFVNSLYKRMNRIITFIKHYQIPVAHIDLINSNSLMLLLNSDFGSVRDWTYAQWYNLHRAEFIQSYYMNVAGESVYKFLPPEMSGLDKSKLANIFQINYSEIDSVLDNVLPDDDEQFIQNPDWLMRLSDISKMLKTLNVTFQIVEGWVGLTASTIALVESETRANSIRNTARSHYSPEAWLNVSEKIMTDIRRKRRDALVNYLTSKSFNETETYLNANDLYDDYLLDTQMEPCFKTTRIVQANLAIQLLMMRVQLSLETGVTISDLAGEEWAWRKKYRLWEANRKVFLYPENWIEPELRKDKSPFFKQLEEDLLQSEVTAENVETAYRNYLHKFDEVAKLEIMAHYYDEEKAELHVFARTFDHPHTYYYRKRNANGYWYAWEAMNIQIEGEHLAPVVFNGVLYLFWMQKDESSNIDSAYKYYLAWTNFQNNKWIATKKSNTYILKSKNAVNGLSFNAFIPSKLNLESSFKDLYFTFQKDIQLTNLSATRSGGNIDDYITFLKEYSQESGSTKITTAQMCDILTAYPREEFNSNSRYVTAMMGIQSIYQIYDTFIKKQLDFICGLRTSTSLSLPTKHQVYLLWEYSEIFGSNNGSGSGNPVDEPIFDVATEYVCFSKNEEVTTGVFNFGIANGNFMSDSGYYSNNKFNVFSGDEFKITYGGADGITLVSQSSPSGNYYSNLRNGFVGILTPHNKLKVLASHGSPFYEDSAVFFIQDSKRVYHAEIIDGGLDTSLAALIGNSMTDTQTSLKSVNVPQYNGLEYIKPYLGETMIKSVLTPFLEFTAKYRFHNFYYPFVKELISDLNTRNDGYILNPEIYIDIENRVDEELFLKEYDPHSVNVPPYIVINNEGINIYPVEEFSFDYGDAYSLYNWELFYHIPMFVANRLSAERRFEEAQQWYHYIFNPTISGDDTNRFWRIKPFIEQSRITYESLTQILKKIQRDSFGLQPGEHTATIQEWLDNPFDPHTIARKRTVAYMKNTLQKYLDNLIAWGDDLFRQDSREYINEAAQLYIWAAQILGQRPAKIKVGTPTPIDYEGQIWDDFANTSVLLENLNRNSYRITSSDVETALRMVRSSLSPRSLAQNGVKQLDHSMLYFCIPDNPQMLAYWDTVADRLFKIRNCMNIEGITRQLALTEPPINPALLVKAAAAGISISSFLSDAAKPLPPYKFRFMVQKALELANDVKSLGQNLLSALEKRDSEKLSLLRSNQELTLLNVVTALKSFAIEEAQANIEALEQSIQNAKFRQNYFKSLKKINKGESAEINLTISSMVLRAVAQSMQLIAATGQQIPQGYAGIMGAFPILMTEYGGNQISGTASILSGSLDIGAGIISTSANLAGLKARYDRRQEEWTFQAATAEREIKQIEKQKLANEIRLAIAQKDLENHKLQIENSEVSYAYMQDKFTNEQLYAWMSGELSKFYFQAYQTAYDFAKQAEKCMQFELNVGGSDVDFLKPDNWNSLYKGLLSGDKLYNQIRQMELAYIENNKREYEITKHISLAMLNPNALLDLRNEGKCDFDVPEILFDLDFPGHYFRRIKSVSLTIPAVTGPYTNINCKLTQTGHKIRISTNIADGYAHTDDDSRFYEEYIPKTVATSSGRNDAGVFEVNFNDERYLPFEGRGVVSAWQLELPDDFRQFDYETISDVVMTVNYTAKEGGLAVKVKEELNDLITYVSDNLPGWSRFFSLKNEFSDNYFALQTALSQQISLLSKGLPTPDPQPEPPAPQITTQLTLSKKLFPYMFKDKSLKINKVVVTLLFNEEVVITTDTPIPALSINGSTSDFDIDGKYGHAEVSTADSLELTGQSATVSIDLALVNFTDLISFDNIQDIVLVCEYEIINPNAPAQTEG